MENPVKALIGESIAVENLDKYISKQGVVVRVSVGGGRNSYYVSSKVYGVIEQNLTDDSHEFIDEHVKDGRIALLPKKDEKRLRAIESRVKKKLKETAVGYDDSFVPISSYPDFREYFDKNKKEFLELRDELSEKYMDMKERFVDIARTALKEMNAVEGEVELEKIISKLPSRDAFTDSFRMDIAVSAFPTMENLDMFDENIRDVIKGGSKSNADDLVTESIGNSLNEGLAALSGVVRSGADTGKIHQRTLLGVRNGAKRMAEKNIFANPKIDEFKNELLELISKDVDDAIESAERVLSQIYAYAKELNLEEKMDLSNCPFTPEELERICEIYA